MHEIQTYDSGGEAIGGGRVLTGLADPTVDNVLELTVHDGERAATVLLGHDQAIALMAQLGRFVATI